MTRRRNPATPKRRAPAAPGHASVRPDPSPRSTPAALPPELVLLGTLGRPWGRRGELTATLHNRDSDLLARVDEVRVAGRDGAVRSFSVERARWVGKRFVVQLGGVADIEAAEALRHAEFGVEPDALPALDDDEFYVRDLIGLAVETADGRALGTLRNVLPTGSNDVYEVDGDDGETLIPALREVIVEIDLERGRMVVDWDPALGAADDADDTPREG